MTPNELAHTDYVKCFKALFELVDYFVVNVSSPNTPGLRELQEKGPLLLILKSLQDINAKKTSPKPIFLKIAPDLNDHQIKEITEIVSESGIAGVVATDAHVIEQIGAGGLSGQPVKKRSTEVIRLLKKHLEPSKIIIGVGGIACAQDAIEKVEAGADLVQIYSGMIYAGPSLIGEVYQSLSHS